jgi:hypothetical protein
MLGLFDAANEETVKEFAESLQKKLKQKFNITLGVAKLLHAIAEMNGHKNWSSLKSNLNDSGFWVINSYAISGICSSKLAPDFQSGLLAFLRECFAYKRFLDDDTDDDEVEELEYRIVAIDEDVTYYGLYLFLNSKVFCSLTRPGVYDAVDGFARNVSGDDLIEAAGLTNSVLKIVGNSESDYEEKLKRLQHSIYQRRFQYDATEYINATGQRAFIPSDQAPKEWVDQIDSLHQMVSGKAKVTDKGVMMS